MAEGMFTRLQDDLECRAVMGSPFVTALEQKQTPILARILAMLTKAGTIDITDAGEFVDFTEPMRRDDVLPHNLNDQVSISFLGDEDLETAAAAGNFFSDSLENHHIQCRFFDTHRNHLNGREKFTGRLE
jgi:hypothetical protein